MGKASRLLSILLLLTVACRRGRKPEPSAIEAVRTAAQVKQLLASVDSSYAEFNIDSVIQLQDKRVERQYRKAGVKAWEKADLDSNGRTDLLVNGWWNDGTAYEETSQAICLMDLGEGKLKLESFGRHFTRYGPIARVIWRSKRPLLSYTDFAPPILRVDSLKDEQLFLLTYKFGGFVEYNEQPNPSAALDSITYKSDFAYDDVLIKKLTLNAAGQAVYHSCEYPVLEVRKKTYVAKSTVVTPTALAEIKALVGYIDPNKLKPEYRVSMNHEPYTYLTLAYHGGPKVKVFDYGEEGTFGLMRLYALLGQLRKNQSWQPVKP